jgi:hypothetical protein
MVLRIRGGWQTYCINFLENSFFCVCSACSISIPPVNALRLLSCCLVRVYYHHPERFWYQGFLTVWLPYSRELSFLLSLALNLRN